MICLKMLEKDPARRYPSMAEVAAELRRFLANQPIHAKAPGLIARASKWCRRHPVVATSSAIVCVALLALSLLLFETMRARSTALRAAETARLEADTSSRVVDFLVGAFAESSPTRAQGRELSAREVLDRGVRNIREGLLDPREAGLLARLLNSLGMVYSRLGLRAQAEEMLREAQALGEQAFGVLDAHTLEIGRELAILLTEDNRLQEALEQWKHVHNGWVILEGADSESALRAEGNLGSAYSRAGQSGPAETHLRHSLSGLEQLGEWRGPGLYSLSEVLRNTGRRDESLAMLRLCITEHERELGSDAPDTLNAYKGLARHYIMARDMQAAGRVWREVAASRSCVQGPTHPATIASRSRVLLLESGTNPERSMYELNELFSVSMRDLGLNSATTSDLARMLGGLYEGRGRHAEAEQLFAQILGAQPAAPLSSPQDRAFNLFALGKLERNLGRADLALSIYEEILDLVETTPPEHPMLIDDLLRESMSAREDSGDLSGALEQGRAWLARTPADHPVRAAIDVDVLRLELQLSNR